MARWRSGKHYGGEAPNPSSKPISNCDAAEMPGLNATCHTDGALHMQQFIGNPQKIAAAHTKNLTAVSLL